MTRWATFDCYGTLIDWNAGIRAALERLWDVERSDELLARYHELEPEVQAEAYRSYAEVLTLTLERRRAGRQGSASPRARAASSPQLAARVAAVPRGSRRARGAAQARLAARGALEHRPRADRRLAAASRRAVRPRSSPPRTSESYKPAHGALGALLRAHDRRARAATSTSRRVTSTTSSRRPSSACARSGSTGSASRREPRPTAELPDLERLPDTLDALVPPS